MTETNRIVRCRTCQRLIIAGKGGLAPTETVWTERCAQCQAPAQAVPMAPNTRRIRVYVACSSRHRDDALKVMGWVRECWHEVVHDWAAIMDREGPDSELSLAVARRHALGDIDGVRRCDVLVCVLHETISPGMHAEIGAALALGKPVFAMMARAGVTRPLTIFEQCAREVIGFDTEELRRWLNRP